MHIAYRTGCSALLLSTSVALAAAADPPATTAPRPAAVSVATLAVRLHDPAPLAEPPRTGESVLTFWGPGSRTAGEPDADGWRICARATGPGAITRIWLGQPAGSIRIRIDDQPPLEGAIADFLAGKIIAAPTDLAPGSGAATTWWAPLPFAKRCEVALRGDPDLLTHHITVRRFPAGTATEPLALPFSEDAHAALDAAAAAWRLEPDELPSVAVAKGAAESAAFTLKRGDTYTWDLDGAAAIRAVHVALTGRRNPRELYALHRCVLRIYFDGARQPHIQAPLIDFFGSGFDHAAYRSVAAGTDGEPPFPLPDRRPGEDRAWYFLLPMPFSAGARIEIENRSGDARPLEMLLYLRLDRQPPPESHWRLCAAYRHHFPAQPDRSVLVSIGGPARLVGATLLTDALHGDWWRTAQLYAEVDDQPLALGAPRLLCWSGRSEPGVADAHALEGLTRSAAPGKTAGYRWLLPDSIPARRSMRLFVQHGDVEGAGQPFIAAVTYWYAPPGQPPELPRMRPEDLDVPGLRVPGAIEFETCLRQPGWGTLLKQRSAGPVELSGDQAASVSVSGEPIPLTLPAPRAGRFRVELRVHPRRPFETIELRDAAGRTLATATYQRNSDGWYELGVLELSAGDNALQLVLSRPAVLDCLVLIED